jgi:hypothetical protein
VIDPIIPAQALDHRTLSSAGHDHTNGGEFLSKSIRCLQALHPRHSEIHHYQLWKEAPNFLYGLVSMIAQSRQVDVRLDEQEAADLIQQTETFINYNCPNWFSDGLLVGIVHPPIVRQISDLNSHIKVRLRLFPYLLTA